MRFSLAGIPLGSRSSSEAVGCRGLYRISAPQVRQNPEPSDSPSLHFQHVISVSSRRSTMPAPVAVALVPYSAAAPPVCGWLAYRRVSAVRPPLARTVFSERPRMAPSAAHAPVAAGPRRVSARSMRSSSGVQSLN